jgi:RNA polymerase sigma-70 factor (ECF subfamily)
VTHAGQLRTGWGLRARRSSHVAQTYLTERELVEGLRAGDENAFVALVQAHQTNMIRLAMTLVNSKAVAEEVVQDTWLGVLRGIDRFEGRCSLKTWLFRILANRARSSAHHERRTVPLDDLEPAEHASSFAADGSWNTPVAHWSDGVNDRIAADTLSVLIRDAIESLPAPQRQVITLRDVEGLSSAEVCEILELTDGNQRVLLHRGRVAVRRCLEDAAKEVD